MADVLVTCITKADRENTHEGITYLGGPAGGGWMWTRIAVINSINAGINTFYTMKDGVRANIGVRNGIHGPYVQTHADGKWSNNLLALTECQIA